MESVKKRKRAVAYVRVSSGSDAQISRRFSICAAVI